MSQVTQITFAGISPPLTNSFILFAPPSYGNDLVAWFEADQNLTVAGGRVTAWGGLGTAAGFSLVGLNGGMTLVPSAQNGLPGVKAVGTNADPTVIQSLSSSTSPNAVYAPLNFNYNQPFTVSAAVVAPPTAESNTFILGQGQAQGSGFGWAVGYRSGLLCFFFFGAGGYGNNWMCVKTGFTPAPGTAFSFEMIYSGATGTPADVTFYVNQAPAGGITTEANGVLTGGTQSTSGFPFGVNPSYQFGISGQTTMLGFAIAKRAALPQQAVSLEKYLNTRFAIHA